MISPSKIIVVLSFFLLSVLSRCKPNLSSADSKPNIILIMTDDQGWYDVGFNGNKNILTPNLDKLASKGIVLDRFYSASAVCSPTRASVLTGRNPLRIGISHANTGHMKEEEITLPELLQNHGYATAHFGKWHLGTLTRKQRDSNRGGLDAQKVHFSIPTQHGYDQFFCTEAKVPTFHPMLKPSIFDDDESLRYGWKALKDTVESLPYGTSYWNGNEQMVEQGLEGHNAKVIMDRVIPFITTEVKNLKPFFSTIWFHTPHLPVVANDRLRSKYKDRILQEQLYYGSITGMDEQIGRLWDQLEKLGIAENTLLWFCSDNGPENGTPGSAGIFRERKRSLYEGGVRVPAFVTWMEKFDGGQRKHFPAVTSDYLPTIIDILDIEMPKHPIDGTSIYSVLLGEKATREKPIGFIFPEYEKISWVDHQYKLISTDHQENFELYDLLQDKSEQDDISESEPAIANSMKEELEAWLASVKSSREGKDYK